jgi:hypothetical protein
MKSEVREFATMYMRLKGWTAKEAVRFVVKQIRDDRGLVDKEWRGNGNRLKRRLGWTLERTYCHCKHDCECVRGWYYEEP